MPSTVSIAVINYQGQDVLPQCLASIARLQGPVIETLVIDNHSRDGSAQAAEKAFPEIRVIHNRHNVGFARACNQAIRATQGDYVAIFNNDIEVDPNWLTALLEVMEQRPSVAAGASKLRLMGSRELLAGAGVGMTRRGKGYDRGNHERDTGQYDRPGPVFAISGAATLIRRSAFEAVGPFDERFFMYHEDVDWCWRVWLHGYEILYVPEAIAFHMVETSTQRYLPRNAKASLGLRHSVRSLLKCYQWDTLRRLLVEKIREDPRIFLGFPLAWRVLGWNLRHLFSTLAERRRIQAGRSRSDRQMDEYIWGGDVPMVPPRRDHPAGLRPDQNGLQIPVCEMGFNDIATLGSGWYHLQSVQPGSAPGVRWSQRSASIHLWQPPGASRLFLQAYSLAETNGSPLQGRVLVNGETIGELNATHDGWVRAEFDVEATETGRWLTVGLEFDHSWKPVRGRVHRRCRDLGVAVQRLGFILPPAPAIARDRSQPPVSMIIPTRDRAKLLEMTLEALLKQQYPEDRLEIIVVDDGSTDDSPDRVRKIQAMAPGRVRYLSQPPVGASKARNLGLKEAQHELVFLFDDDIVSEPDLIAQHVATHQRHNRNRDVAVVGYSRWPLEQNVTIFLDYIGEWGPQFGYRFMREGDELSFNCFYSSNVSLYKETCGELALTEESLPFYWYDTELGYRLAQRGMRILYNPRAIGYHYGARTLQEFETRQTLVGQYAVLFSHLYPELVPWLMVDPPKNGARRSLRQFVVSAVRFSLQSPRAHLRRWYEQRLRHAYEKGVEEGWKKFPAENHSPIER